MTPPVGHSTDGDSLRLDQSGTGRIIAGPYAQGAQIRPSGQGIPVLILDPGQTLTLADNFSLGGLIELSWMQAEGSRAHIFLGQHELVLSPTSPTVSLLGGTLLSPDPGARQGVAKSQLAPASVAARGPGLWQHLTLHIRRTAPGMGAGTPGGLVLMLARLNGVVVQAGIDLGPAPHAAWPVRLTNQQGALAVGRVRRIVIDGAGQLPRLGQISYEVSDVRRLTEAPTDSMMAKPRLKGTSATLDYRLAGRPNEFALRARTTLEIPRPGRYRIDFLTGGGGQLKIGNFPMIERGAASSPWGKPTPLTLDLEAGTYPVDLLYYKTMNSILPTLALTISGPGVLDHPLQGLGSSVELGAPPPYPLFVEARPKVQRCFMKTPDGKLHPYTLMVGTPTGLHYAYDLAQGSLLAVWRGAFADVGGMWRDRGSDQIAFPLGAVVTMTGGPGWALASGESGSGMAWPDTLDPTRWKLAGYQIDADGYPTLLYEGTGGKVADHYRPSSDGLSLTRTLTWSGAPAAARVQVLATPSLTLSTQGSSPTASSGNGRRRVQAGDDGSQAIPYAHADGCLIRQAPAGTQAIRPLATTSPGGSAAQPPAMLIAPLDSQGKLSYTLWF